MKFFLLLVDWIWLGNPSIPPLAQLPEGPLFIPLKGKELYHNFSVKAEFFLIAL